MKYDLNDKIAELKEDLRTFGDMKYEYETNPAIAESVKVEKVKMYSHLFNETVKEINYCKELIADKGVSFDNYDYI